MMMKKIFSRSNLALTGENLDINVNMNTFDKLYTFYEGIVRLTENEPSCKLHMA